VVEGVDGARPAILRCGATPGDKTMVDSLVPFADVLGETVEAGEELPAAWTRAAAACTEAAAATAQLLPKMSRARPHAEKSLGTPDAGAHSLALIVTAIGAVLRSADAPASAAAPDATAPGSVGTGA